MIKNYKFVYGTDEAKVWFSIDTEVFTKEMAESNLEFFDWYYDKEADPIEEIIKKYAMKAIVASSMGGYMNNVYSIQQEFDNCEGFCKVDGSIGILLISISAYEFNEDYLENDN
jgi:hypothetical protein